MEGVGQPRRSDPLRFPVRVLPFQFGGPQDFWDEQEREHRAHARNLKRWGVVLAVFAILGLAVHPVFFGFGAMLAIGALFTVGLWWTTRRRTIPDYRRAESVEVELEVTTERGPDARIGIDPDRLDGQGR